MSDGPRDLAVALWMTWTWKIEQRAPKELLGKARLSIG